MSYSHRKPYEDRIDQAMSEMMAMEVEAIRSELLKLVMSPHVNLQEFIGSAIAYWEKWLGVDRIFVCDMRTGMIVAGWNTGKNIIKLSDWDPVYVPIEDDATLQMALESDELIAAPVDGEGADLAFSIHFSDQLTWLVVFDQTNTARRFTPLDMAYVGLVRDLVLVKYLVMDRDRDRRSI